MKRNLLLLLLLPALAFVSCDDDDDYSLDKYWIGLATVENPDNEANFYIKLDNNELLWIAANNFYNYRPHTGQRILADYTILNDKPEGSGYDHDVKLNDAYNILTKGIIQVTPSMQDSIGNDPIDVRDIWVGSDYLNIKFSYRGQDRKHMLNLVSDSSKVYTDGKVHLEFRHNAHQDSPTYVSSGLVSFNLESLRRQPRENSIELVIHVKETDNSEKTYERTYKFGEENKETKEFDRDYFTNGKELNIE